MNTASASAASFLSFSATSLAVAHQTAHSLTQSLAMKNMERAKSFVASRSTPSECNSGGGRYKAEKTFMNNPGIMTNMESSSSGKSNKFKRCNSLTASRSPFGVGQHAQTTDPKESGRYILTSYICT